ncbi:MAG TPA: TetR/AcrR family transcriptional regulator [Chthonomonadaceae bacterium]|nr:TetR/AcrR family transcriptional regulator [Chthonomonadaceae bacterium]
MTGPASSREKILQCAKDLFYHVGYQSTSVDDILRACGVAKSNFYYHFKTKEDLAVAVLELRIAEYEALILGSLQNPVLTPAERLREFFDRVHQAQAKIAARSGCPFGNFAAALPNPEKDARYERFRLRLGEFFRRMEAAMQDCLAEGVERGEFRSDLSSQEMAAFLVAVVQGLLILTKTYKDTAPLITGFAVVQQLLRAK